MSKAICWFCHYADVMQVFVAGVRRMVLHCGQGVPGSPDRSDCPIFVREPGTDDDVAPVRRGRWPVVGECR